MTLSHAAVLAYWDGYLSAQITPLYHRAMAQRDAVELERAFGTLDAVVDMGLAGLAVRESGTLFDKHGNMGTAT
jgi:hypothetical protein